MTPLARRIESAKQWWRERLTDSAATPEQDMMPAKRGVVYLRSVIAVIVLIQMLSGILLSLNYTPSVQPLRNDKGDLLAPYHISADCIDADGDTLFRRGDNLLLPADPQARSLAYAGIDSTAFNAWTKQGSVTLIPSAAWLSVEYQNGAQNVTQNTTGSYIRSIHSLCAHLCIGLSLLYIIGGFLLGIYRAPKEVGWMAAILLLLLLFAFAWSGSILPWNQRSYASLSIVASSIEQYLPLIGEKVAYFLRGGNAITNATLPRIHIVHILLCPLLLVGVYHVFKKTEGKAKLPPYAAAVIASIIMLVAYLVTPTLLPSGEKWLPYDALHPIQRTAVKPEWYFLDAYYMLREYPSDAAALLLGGSILLYLFVPFIEGRFRKPLVIRVIVCLVTMFLMYCLIRGIMI